MPEKNPLKTSLKNLLEQESLQEHQLDELEQLQFGTTERWFQQRRKLLVGGSGAIAASALLFAGHHFYQSDTSIHESIVREVLTNHIHIRKLDIETGSINEVASYFDRLAFAPSLSSQINGDSFELLGGRYCTLQGELASQLYLRNIDNGELATYYLAQYDRQHFGDIPDVTTGDIPKIIHERGYQMTIWRESNIVNVFTQPGSV
jgi:hypothetical protein